MAVGISGHVKTFQGTLSAILARVADKVVARLLEQWSDVEKATWADRVQALIDAAVRDADFVELERATTKELARQFKRAGYSSLVTLRVENDESIVELMDPRAQTYARARAAELVGRRLEVDSDGRTKIVDNPNPQWSITQSTRELLGSKVTEAIEEGWSSDKLAAEIRGSFAFSDKRAQAIARTELAFAHVAGHEDVARELGAKGKRSILGSEHAVDVPEGCICDDAAAAGIVEFDEEFVPGYKAPPYHPHCVCDVEFIYEGDKRLEKGMRKSAVDDHAHVAATSMMNLRPAPTTPQKDAGNYKMGHTVVSGIRISIENPAGTKRKEGWPVLRSHYGYIKRTVGADGENIDCFVRENIQPDYSDTIWIVYQLRADGTFDEHKVMIGWPKEEQAREAYLVNYTPGWKMGPMKGVTIEEFKVWMLHPDEPVLPIA